MKNRRLLTSIMVLVIVVSFMSMTFAVTAKGPQKEEMKKKGEKGKKWKKSESMEEEMTRLEKMKAVMESPRSDAEDRTYDSIWSVQRNIRNIRSKIRENRRKMLFNYSEMDETQLENYVMAENALTDIRSALEIIQKNMSDCTALTAEAEMAAANQKIPVMTNSEKAVEMAVKSNVALGVMTDSIRDLESALKNIDDPSLADLTEYLKKESEALDKAINLCESSLREISAYDAELKVKTMKEKEEGKQKEMKKEDKKKEKKM